MLTPHKAARLGELAIRPARIAFDHIEDVEEYKKAVRLCAESGITHISNYLLYNGVDFKGKGHDYKADRPEDLYERMHISMDLQEELIKKTGHRVSIFSFPMRYIPLEDLKRGFVGARWNAKYLRALQRMLIPTQGKGVSSRSFFEADFGTSPEQFVKFLAMPEDHVGWRGHFVRRKNETNEEAEKRESVWRENQEYLKEWERLFNQLGDGKDKFIEYIKNNDYSIEHYLEIQESLHKKLFIHYFTIPTLLKSFTIDNAEARNFIIDYISQEFPLMYERMIRYVAESRIPYSMLIGAFDNIGKMFVKSVLGHIDYQGEEPFVINNLVKVQKRSKNHIFNFELVRCFFLYKQVGALSEDIVESVVMSIKNLDERKTRRVLAE